MLSKDQLVKHLTDGRTAGFIQRIASILKNEPYQVTDLIDLTFHPDKKLGFRAMWLLDRVILADPEKYAYCLPYFLSRIKEVNNESCKRHYARIMMFMTMPDAPEIVRTILDTLDLEDTVAQFFDWIINPKVKIAVKVFSADALCNLSNRYDWIAEEITNQITFMMRDGGPAIQSRGKKLLEKLRK